MLKQLIRKDDDNMCDSQLRDNIDKLIDHCTKRIQWLQTIKTCKNINESKPSSDIFPDDKYNDLSGGIFKILLQKGEFEIANQLNKLSKEFAGTIELYIKTKTLIENLKKRI